MTTIPTMPNRNIADTNTINYTTFMSTASAIPNSNITSSITILPTGPIKNHISGSSHNHMNMSNLMNDDLILYSPMHVEVSFLSLILIVDAYITDSRQNLKFQISLNFFPKHYAKIYVFQMLKDVKQIL